MTLTRLHRAHLGAAEPASSGQPGARRAQFPDRREEPGGRNVIYFRCLACRALKQARLVRLSPREAKAAD